MCAAKLQETESHRWIKRCCLLTNFLSVKHSLFKGNTLSFYRAKTGGWAAEMGGADGEVTGWSNDKLQYKLTLNIVI